MRSIDSVKYPLSFIPFCPHEEAVTIWILLDAVLYNFCHFDSFRNFSSNLSVISTTGLFGLATQY